MFLVAGVFVLALLFVWVSTKEDKAKVPPEKNRKTPVEIIADEILIYATPALDKEAAMRRAKYIVQALEIKGYKIQ